jgi:thiamine biosynthesis lipoprotein
MSLDLGGIAKGFAGDVMLAILAGYGVEAALIDAGGDLVAGAAPPGTDGWRVSGSNGAVLLLAHGAVATSGDRFRYLEVDGVKYSHIVDPRTGLGVVDVPTVTVLAPNGTTADVLASALSIMDPEDGADLLASVEGARRLESQGTHR